MKSIVVLLISVLMLTGCFNKKIEPIDVVNKVLEYDLSRMVRK